MAVSSAGEVYAQVAATAQAGTNSDWLQEQQQQQHSDSDDLLPSASHNDQQQQQQRQHLSVNLSALLKCLQRPYQQQQQMPASLKKASSTTSSSRKVSAAPKHYHAARASSSNSSGLTPPPSNQGVAISSSKGSSTLQRHIIVLDEVDNIAKCSLSDLVQLFQLPHTPGVQVMVVGIANCIDLTERTLPELKLQLVTPRLLTFNAYTTRQLAAILDSVVQQLPCK